MRAVRVWGVAIAVCAIAPASASGAFVQYAEPAHGTYSSWVEYRDSTEILAEINDVAISGASATSVTIRERRGTLVLPNLGTLLPALRYCSFGLTSVTCRGAISSIEASVLLGNGNDRATVTTPVEALGVQGGPGSDFLTGSAGGDQLWGAAGNDTIEGGPGDDTLETRSIDSNLGTGDGADLVRAGDGDDGIGTVDGVRDQIECGPGIDAVRVDSLDVVSDCEHVTVQSP